MCPLDIGHVHDRSVGCPWHGWPCDNHLIFTVECLPKAQSVCWWVSASTRIY